MADESAWNSHDVVDIIERRAAQIVSIYTTKPGGLYRAMEVAAVCRAAGIICNVNGSAELASAASPMWRSQPPPRRSRCVGVPGIDAGVGAARAGWRHLLQR